MSSLDDSVFSKNVSVASSPYRIQANEALEIIEKVKLLFVNTRTIKMHSSE